ncbi:MAG: hypothetical protein NZ738_06240, partial [Oceanospirillaceae bacterium]|jgi:hypothetical protein|nr:hypothetical protein [Oceanospirillaceae bacterium]
MATSTRPTLAAIETLLRDGYWDRTEIIRMADGSLRVRKQSKGQQSSGPWGQDNLRAEALYLQDLEPHLLDLFPRLIASWEEPAPGYDMAYMTHYVDVAQLVRKEAFNQQQANEFQSHLGKRVFGQLHTQCTSQNSLAENVLATLQQAALAIRDHNELQALTTPSMGINGQVCLNLAANTATLIRQQTLLYGLDAAPQVRLHGDLFLENILLPATSENEHWPTQLVLIDPVSVAGMGAGHPLFDLAKYESYASGELPAMRRGHTMVDGMDNTDVDFSFAIDWQHPEMQPFKVVNWHSMLRQSYISHYGVIDDAMYALLEAYFAAAMVLCTEGIEQQARALKATFSLQSALSLAAQ